MSHPEKGIPSDQKRTREKSGRLVLSKDTVFQMRDDVSMLEVRHCHLCPSGQRLSSLWSSHCACASTLPPAPPWGTFPDFHHPVAQTSTRASELISTCEMENFNISLIFNYHGGGGVCTLMMCFSKDKKNVQCNWKDIYLLREGTWSWLKVVDKWDLSFIWFIIVFK